MSGTKKSAGRISGIPASDPSDVEVMLRAAEEEVLLGLRVSSHTVSSSSALDPDLSRRFEALKLSLPPSDSRDSDLMTRFAALKGNTDESLPMADSLSIVEDSADDGDDASKGEVEKLISWAMDAARLDPFEREDEDDGIVREGCKEYDCDMELEWGLEEEEVKRSIGKGTRNMKLAQ